jgi:UrcA family protein
MSQGRRLKGANRLPSGTDAAKLLVGRYTMKNLTLSNILAAASISLIAGFSTSAAAAQFDETLVQGDYAEIKAVHVQYLPSDLATAEGREILHSRLRQAAKKVCGPTNLRDAGGLREMSRNRQCYDQAFQAASSQIGFDQVAVISD